MSGRALSLFFIASVLSHLCCATYTPYHVYITLTGDPSEMQLTFTTTSIPPSAKIDYYPTSDPTQKLSVSAASNDTIHFITPFKRSEYITTLTMTDLTPQTEYSYSILCDSSKPSEATYEFKTLPEADDPVNIVLYGDMGYKGAILVSDGSGGLNAWAKSYKMDFIVHYGDLAYNLASENGTIGDLFMKALEPISARIPYVSTAGNHEYSDDKKSEPMYRNWFLGLGELGKRSGSSDPVMWHSYDIGTQLHMVGINTEVYCEETDKIQDQMVWLANDLAKVRARAVQPWIIVYGHRQMYDGDFSAFHSVMMRLGVQCTDANLTNCDMLKPCYSGVNCAYSLEDIFHEYKVDIYFAGHMHAYNRMLPISPSLVFEAQKTNVHYNPQNPIYILSGAAGLEHIPKLDHSHGGARRNSLTDTNGGASIFFNSANHTFTAMSVYNTSHLLLRQIMLDDNILDELWVIKSSLMPPWTQTTPFKIGSPNTTICDQ